MFPFQTLNFEKGSQQKLHSDFYHFAPSDYSSMAGVWVALEDISCDAGPLKIVPGSHKFDYLFPDDLSIPVASKSEPYKYYHLYEAYIEELIESSECQIENVTLGKGDLLIWHSNLIHGGDVVRDKDLTRYSQVTHYLGSGLTYYSPITSRRDGIFNKSYRFPLDVTNNKRHYPLGIVL